MVNCLNPNSNAISIVNLLKQYLFIAIIMTLNYIDKYKYKTVINMVCGYIYYASVGIINISWLTS